MKFCGNKYGTLFINTEEKEKQFMHNMNNIAVDATFTKITANKGRKGNSSNVKGVNTTIGHGINGGTGT